MNRKSLLLGLGLVLLLAGVAGAAVLLLEREPDFYRAPDLPEGNERKVCYGKFKTEISAMFDGILNERPWECRVTAEQINSYFAEEFVPGGTMANVLPPGLSEPRVSLDTDKFRMGFRYGTEPWSAVVSIDLGVWLVPREPNTIALELQGMRAGTLPISAQSLLETVCQTIRAHNIDPSGWYRHNGNPVTLLRFQADRPQPIFRLLRLELRPGEMVIGGCAYNESLPLSPALTANGR